MSKDTTPPQPDAQSLQHSSTQAALLKSWLQKLLVMFLCALSFYAGWQAHHSRMVRQCQQSGGKASLAQGVFSCEFPKQ